VKLGAVFYILILDGILVYAIYPLSRNQLRPSLLLASPQKCAVFSDIAHLSNTFILEPHQKMAKKLSGANS